MKVLAIGVSGGPASGINAAIRSVVNHGRHFGYEVVGLHDAFSRLTRQLPDAFETLTTQRIEGISEMPGSILGLSKPGIPTSERDFDLILAGFRERDVHDLIWIGGDDSSRILSRLIKHARKQGYELRVALIPKTIDNDVYLTPPERAFEESTLGFSSAVLAGTRSVSGFLADAAMSNKWWLWVAMGRSAGHLTLGIYKRTEAEAFLLGEELEEGSSPDLVVDLLLGTILKKSAKKNGGRYGVAIISENIIEKLILPELKLTRSDMGNLNLAEFDLASFLAAELRRKCAALGFAVSIDSHAMGRDNRTAQPAPTDVSLGFAMGAEAVRALRSGANEVVVSVRNDMPHSFPFAQLVDPETGEPRTRCVSMEVVRHVIERCLWRVHPSDLSNLSLMEAVAGNTSVSPEALTAMLRPSAERFGSPSYF